LISKQFTLGKRERLKSRKLIEKVFREGKSLFVFPYRIYYLINPWTMVHPSPKPVRPGAGLGPMLNQSSSGLQFAVGVSKKNFKKAVDRNRIKRLTREAFRLQKQYMREKIREKNQCLTLFFIYTAKELPSYPALYEKMHVILNRLITIADENYTNPD
jgi:ribonuclease P protein component